MKFSKLKNTFRAFQDSNIEIPLRDSLFKSRSSIDYETLGLSFSQRMICFLVMLLVGTVLFIYSFMSLFTAIFNPRKFVFPYVLSNLLFFLMMGFLRGFKSYFRSLLIGSRKKYTIFFISTTIFTFFTCFYVRVYIVNLLAVILQIVGFSSFFLTFIPFGLSTLNGITGIFFN